MAAAKTTLTMAGSPSSDSAPSELTPASRIERWRAGLGWFGRASVDLLFPPACVLCQTPLDDLRNETPLRELNSSNEAPPSQHVAPFCEPCRRRLLPPTVPRCRRCGADIMHRRGDGQRCDSCRAIDLHFASVVPLGDYDDELRRAVLLTKEKVHQVLCTALTDLLWEQCGAKLTAWEPDLVAAVPMHWSQRLKRGVSNADEIAVGLAKRLRVPHGPRLLIRRRNTEPQSTLSRSRRFENVRDAFRVSKCYRLHQTRILLVDDILTTGATSSEAARTLLSAGASKIDVAVLAKSHRPANR